MNLDKFTDQYIKTLSPQPVDLTRHDWHGDFTRIVIDYLAAGNTVTAFSLPHVD